MFDAECDFAAIAYRTGDDPDRLLLGFADDVARAGFRTAGLIQFAHDHAANGTAMRALLLPGRETIRLTHASRGAECRIDTDRLASVADTIAAAIRTGPDLVIINRFGKLEGEGCGLIGLIEQAVAADIPVLAAVPEHRFATFIRYSGGMNVRLPCRRAVLDQWWQSVCGRAPRRAASARFCELAR